ncbi:hypothetical protein AGMMS49928_01550 [Spirochaetia bacterium]|nr:hypothetical protein AGMMS49928_01550 [Spirochaetia bacterium]
MKTNKLFMRGVLAAILIVLGAANVMAQVTPPDEDFEVTQNKDGKTLTISGYKGSAKNIIIPETLYGLPVTVIGGSAFYEKDLTSVVIPDGVITIGNRAFSNNKLASVTFGKSVTTIDGDNSSGGAFSNNQLTSVTIPDSVTTIRLYAFSNNPLTSVTLGKGLTIIQHGAFGGNTLTTITIAKDVLPTGDRYNNPGINTGAGFEENFVNFYIGQKRTPGTYIKNGPIWSKK